MLPKLTDDDIIVVLQACLDEVNYPLDAKKIPTHSIGRFIDQLDQADASDDWHAPLAVFTLRLNHAFLKRGWEILDLEAEWFGDHKDDKFSALVDFIAKNSVYIW